MLLKLLANYLFKCKVCEIYWLPQSNLEMELWAKFSWLFLNVSFHMIQSGICGKLRVKETIEKV